MNSIPDHPALGSLERRFCHTLMQAARAWRRVADTTATDFGLSEATAYPLVMMSQFGDGLRQTVLADIMGIEGPTLVRLLDQLCAAGLVKRREDPIDKRAKTLHLTQKGRTVTANLIKALDATRARVFDQCPPDDLLAGLRIFAAIERAAAEVRS